jgi:hypothetical protein
MGEMADEALDGAMHMEGLRLDYLSGRMDDNEAYDYGIIDESGAIISQNHVTKSKTCRCCGTGGLIWGQHEGKWRLFDNGKLHQCKVNPLE